MEKHARLSPSSRHRWSVCPGSIREESKYEERNSPSSIDGTHTHTLLSECIKFKLADPIGYVGFQLEDHEGKFTVDVDRANRVKVAIDYLKDRIGNDDPTIIQSEHKVDPCAVIGRDDMYGTLDVCFIKDRVLEIIDFKDGIGHVEVKGNLQLEHYGISKIASIPHINGDYGFDTVRMTIIQPKLQLTGHEPIDSIDVPLVEFFNSASVSRLIEEAKRTDDPSAPLVPGEKQCKFCRARGNCIEMATRSLSAIGVSFPKIETDEIYQQVADQDANRMSDEMIGRILEAAPLVRQFMESAEEEAINRIKAGKSIPGFKVVYGRGSRSWKYSDEEMIGKLTRMGIPKSMTHVSKLISPAQARDLNWTKRDGTKKQLSKRQLETMEKEFIHKSTGKLTVVPESDNRESVVFDASPMFTAVQSPMLPSWMLGK